MTGGAGTAISVWLSGEAACNNNAQDQIILTNRNNPLGIQLALICHFTPWVTEQEGGRRGVFRQTANWKGQYEERILSHF